MSLSWWIAGVGPILQKANSYHLIAKKTTRARARGLLTEIYRVETKRGLRQGWGEVGWEWIIKHNTFTKHRFYSLISRCQLSDGLQG